MTLKRVYSPPDLYNCFYFCYFCFSTDAVYDYVFIYYTFVVSKFLLSIESMGIRHSTALFLETHNGVYVHIFC